MMKTNRSTKVYLLGLAILCLMGSQVRADVLAYETFDFEQYEVGQSLLGNAAAVQGFDGAWELVRDDGGNDEVLASSLEVAGLPLSSHAFTSGSLIVRPRFRVGRFLDTSADGPFGDQLTAEGSIGKPGTSVFLSFMMKPDSTGYFWAFEIKRGGLGDTNAVLYIGNDVGNPAGTVQLCAFRNRSQDPANIGKQLQWAGDASVEPELYVLRVDFNGGEADNVHLWRNPPLDQEPDVADAATLTGAGDLSFDGISLAAFVGPVCTFDEICIGETFSDVVSAYPLELATDPDPGYQMTDVPWNTVLSWAPGNVAGSHDVYFGTVFEDVSTASRANPLGVLLAESHTGTTYDAGNLEFGQTYFWRIDEVSAAQDGTIFPGYVWSFTVEPEGIVLASDFITATASSANDPNEGPENAINSSGVDANDMHSVVTTDMWRTSMTDASPWIEFEFDRPYKLHQMLVWNHNSELEPDIGFGIREATVEYSLDGTDWIVLDAVELAQASGEVDYAANTAVAFEGATAQYVRVTPVSNWGGILPQFGLSEVRFLHVPVRAREPEPASGTADLVPQVALSWRAGRQSALHDVYLSTDEQAVLDGTAPVVTVSEALFDTEPLNLGQTYYWCVDEVNDAEEPAVWGGDIWNFTVTDTIVVEDFEVYADDEGSRIYETWADGWNVPANGSQVGYGIAPFAEQTVRYGGLQSMPLFYDNTDGATDSVATRTFAEAQYWTASAIQGLVLYFHGDPANTGGQLYVKINGAKVPYDGDSADLMRGAWNKWYVVLADVSGANLSQVTSLSVGIDGGGQGVLYVDDIFLTPTERELIVPVEPDTAGLVAYWNMDEGPGATTLADSAGGDNDATVHSGTTGVPGKFGNAIEIGGDDPVTAPDTGLPAGVSSCTMSAWFKQTSDFINGNGVLVSYGTTGAESGMSGQYRALAKNNASAYRVFHWDADMAPATAKSPAAPDVWHHLTFTFDKAADTQAIYLDGVVIGTATIPDNLDVALNGKVIFGDMDVYTQIFNGLLDEVRIYDRVLSPDEIAWLGGRTIPFDK